MRHKMVKYLELSEDDMVNLLAEFQTLAKDVYITGSTVPYLEAPHKRACKKYLDKGKWLAMQGKIV